MGDIVVMADPVQELSAAVGIVPAPVLVEVIQIEGQVFRGADPEFVVNFFRRLRVWRFAAGAGEITMALRQSDFDSFHFADVTVEHQLRALPEVGHAPLPGAGLPNATILFDGVHNGHALGEGMRQRLLAVNVFFRSRGLDRRNGMPVIRRRDAHGVNVLSSQ